MMVLYVHGQMQKIIPSIGYFILVQHQQLAQDLTEIIVRCEEKNKNSFIVIVLFLVATGSGYYLYIETSLPAQSGWIARLESELYLDTRPRCFSFWYHMHGVDIGSLRVYFRSFTTGNFTTDSLAWILDGQQGNEWRHGFVPIRPTGRYQVVIEGLYGRSFDGDVAIDDIGVLPTETCVLQPIQADPIGKFQEKFACGFETDFCQWQMDPTGKFNWTRHTESTPSTDTGPCSGNEQNKEITI